MSAPVLSLHVVSEPPSALFLESRTVDAVDDVIASRLTSLRAEWSTLASVAAHRPGDLRVDSILELLESMVGSGGKRLRSRLCHWGWVAGFDGARLRGYDSMVTAAAALELLHTFALVHDDVMDASPTRRGRPTTHVVAAAAHRTHGGVDDPDRFGENIAILVGDLVHSEATGLAAALPPRLQRVWRTLSVELMLGQGRDLLGAAMGRRDVAHAREVARIKSGAYTVARPLELGAVAAGASPLVIERLASYGEHVGVAFALRDDVLGAFGTPELTGKPVGDDLTAGKPTMLLALAAERFAGPDADLLALAGTPEMTGKAVTQLQEALVRTGVLADVETLIEDSIDAALSALDTARIPSEAIQGLTAIAHQIAWRSA